VFALASPKIRQAVHGQQKATTEAPVCEAVGKRRKPQHRAAARYRHGLRIRDGAAVVEILVFKDPRQRLEDENVVVHEHDVHVSALLHSQRGGTVKTTVVKSTDAT
jgi:hypothetical protein